MQIFLIIYFKMEEIQNLFDNPMDIIYFQLTGILEDQVLRVIREKYDIYIKNRKVSLASLSKELHIGKKKLKKIFSALKFELKPQSRQKKETTPEILEKVLTTKVCFDVGYKRIKDSYFISDNLQNFQDQYLFIHHKKSYKSTITNM